MARIVKVASLLVLLWLAYQLTQLIIPKPDVRVGMQLEPVPATTLTNHAPQVIVKQAHLSGATEADQVSVEPTPIEAPSTRIEMVLQGTFISDNAQIAQAIIADTSGKEEIYSVGDEAPDGSKVHEILADRVILVRKQRYKTLHLLHDDIKDVIINPGLASTHKKGHQSDSLDFPTMKELPASLNELVSPQPVRVSGKFIGIRVKSIKDPYLMDKLGLQQGDVITWINGVDLENPIKGMRALKSISSGDYVNMTVVRNGLDISLSFYMP